MPLTVGFSLSECDVLESEPHTARAQLLPVDPSAAGDSCCTAVMAAAAAADGGKQCCHEACKYSF